MELKTFGAVVTFALETEERTLALLKDICAGPYAQDKPFLSELARMKGRHLKNLEQIRRENVTEMILEPIAGLRGEDYLSPGPFAGNADPEGTIGQLLDQERLCARFLLTAGEKIRQGDVARIFKKLGREKEAFLSAMGAGLE